MAASRVSRAFRALLFAVGVALFAVRPASAATACVRAAEAGVERCVSGLSAAAITAIFQAQQASNWCWAASVAMVLRRYGGQVSQEEVVRTAVGLTENQRASERTVSDLLNRTWRDALGQTLVASAEAVARWRRGMGLAAPEVLDDLARGNPLLLGAQEHAMVLVQVTYERRVDGKALTPSGVRLVRALALDPASGNWLRSLRASELQPEFLTRVVVRVLPAGPALVAGAADSLQ